MECSKKPGSNPDWFESIKINIPDKMYFEETKKEIDRIAKPLDGLGDFENVISRIGAIKKNRDFSLDKKALIPLTKFLACILDIPRLVYKVIRLPPLYTCMSLDKLFDTIQLYINKLPIEANETINLYRLLTLDISPCLQKKIIQV